ncbi:DNA-binding domain-containing protein [Dyella humicola]|uniref:HvfC/BufC N-terminal domain-containing protein n=1 Tax=Dyella humicola TaxID=2992126 RepID=UPI002251DC3D|nr:DNA-binding domain-containing protein [Dyella humicola]
MNLLSIQQRMRTWVTRSTNGQETDAQKAPGYGVYQNNYRAQLVRCLEASYPMLDYWLGHDEFVQAAIQHVNRHPPKAWTLDAYGADFNATLQERYPHSPDIQEFSWIEWSLAESFVAPDADVPSTRILSELNWDNARLYLTPSLRQIEATTNAAELWHAWLAGECLPESEMLPVVGGLITWRKGFVCQLRQLDAIEHAALRVLHDDNRFVELCSALVDHLGEDSGVRRSGEFLANWVQSGVVHCAI